MKISGGTMIIGAILLGLLNTAPVYCVGPDAVIDVHVDKPTVSIPETMYGIFYEDINHAADGGLYAELVRNRTFVNYPAGKSLEEGNSERYSGAAWREIKRGGGTGTITVENKQPLNDVNTLYARIEIKKPGGGVGIANLGFSGIYVEKDKKYDFSFYARVESGKPGPITIAIESESGAVMGTAVIENLTGEWKKYEAEIIASGTDEKASLVVTATGTGVLCVDMVSLFPRDTFKGRKNGLRKDLAQAVADLKPALFRFPGGCIAHGSGLANAYRWKETIGDVAERKGKRNLWGYWQSFGLGYYEYFLYCEDIGAEPLPVLPVGVGCGFRNFQAAPMNELQPWIDDVLDLVEFANGSVTSKWGRIRSEMGHPAPFNLKYICLGNEEHDTPEFRERFPYFVKSLRENYPEIIIIGTSGLGPGIPLYENMAENKIDISDEHYYESPQWFIRNRTRFDSFDRNKPKIFVGEYASGGNTLYNAIAEAVYLTGIEKNADLVIMTAYAPTYARYNYTQWGTANLIWFDHKTVVPTPSYHVQKMFSCNRGDRYLTSEVRYTEKAGKGSKPARGQVGVGTWNTQAEFDDIRVEAGGKTILNEKFSDEAAMPTHVSAGTFKAADGVYVQSSLAEGAVSLLATPVDAERITYSLRAKKTGGSEGFLVVFGRKDSGGFYWWNIGGWGNSRHGLEKGAGAYTGGKENLASRNGSIKSDVWYDIRVELDGPRIKCYLNNELIHDVVEQTESALAVSAVEDTASGEIILKIANAIDADMMAEINLDGVKDVSPKASALVMSGESGAINDLAEPGRIEPEARDIRAGKKFKYTIPASSVQILRVKVKK